MENGNDQSATDQVEVVTNEVSFWFAVRRLLRWASAVPGFWNEWASALINSSIIKLTIT